MLRYGIRHHILLCNHRKMGELHPKEGKKTQNSQLNTENNE